MVCLLFRAVSGQLSAISRQLMADDLLSPGDRQQEGYFLAVC
jgi:hypothetical protein